MALRSDALGEVLEAAEGVDLPSQPGNTALLKHGAREAQRARRLEALSLRLAGLSWEQIGDRLDIDPDSARHLVNRSLERAENRAANEMRDIENARLDRAQAAIWSKVLEGDLGAINTFVRISQRRATMNGFDSPRHIVLSTDVQQEMMQAFEVLEGVVLAEVINDD